MPQNLLTLTRQSLYDLVWSKPMSELAKEFGITDVGLAKRCRQVDVPIPYRGYWARVAAGQTPPKTPLPKYRNSTPPPPTSKAAAKTEVVREFASTTRTGPEPIVHFGKPVVPPDPHGGSGTLDPIDIQRLLDLIAGLGITPGESIADTVAAIRRTAKHLKHPSRAELRFARGENTGPIIDIVVTQSALDRSLLLGDHLLRLAEKLGWLLEAPPPPEEPQPHGTRWQSPSPAPKPNPVIAHLNIDGEIVQFRIEEHLRKEPREPTKAELAREKREYGYHAPRIEFISTGHLRVVRLEPQRYWGPKNMTWYDRARNPVEDQLPRILVGFYELALELKAKRAEAESERLRREEEQRIEKDRQERRAAHSQLIATLERQAGAWHRARFLRRYVQAARRALGGRRVAAPFRDETIDFFDWATAYVEQLDPLSETPSNPDQLREKPEYYRSDDEILKSVLQRLFNVDGKPTKILSTQPIPADTDEEDELDND